MKIRTQNPTTKLCHAKPGDVIRFVDDASSYFMICIDPEITVPATHPGGSGLYSITHMLYLVNLQTGHFMPRMPHLSTEVELCNQAYFCHGGHSA